MGWEGVEPRIYWIFIRRWETYSKIGCKGKAIIGGGGGVIQPKRVIEAGIEHLTASGLNPVGTKLWRFALTASYVAILSA